MTLRSDRVSPRWIHASTGASPGYSVELLVWRGMRIGQLDKLGDKRCYGNVLGMRTGLLAGDRRRARRAIRRRAIRAVSEDGRFGIAGFLKERTR
jgi:hypothetical protein